MTGPILLFGAGGQLGRETMDLAKTRSIDLVGLTRAEGDITDRNAIRAALERFTPRLIVNAAAYTAVDKAESDVPGAFAGNASGPQNLAVEANARSIPLIHFSTDYVFDGAKLASYVETDPIGPAGAYGRSKAEGEALVRAELPHHVIIRTAWVYGAHGANFLKTMLRLAGERDELRVVADQHGCPTATIDLAEAIFAVDRAISAGIQPWGTYHFAGTGVTTWHGFANEIIEAANSFNGKRPKVTAIQTADFPTPARRPVNSALDSTHFTGVFGYRAAPWQDRTRDVVRQLMQNTSSGGLQ